MSVSLGSLPANPCSNTGLDSRAILGHASPPCSSPNYPNSNCLWSARPDWVQGVCESASVGDFLFLVAELERILGTAFDVRWCEAITIGKRWHGYAKSPLGALVAYHLADGGCEGIPSEGALCSIWMALPGECWSTTSPERQRLLIGLVPRFNLRVTRLDLALDDFGRKLRFSDVVDAVKAGNFSGARNFYLYESGHRGSSKTGVAVTIGSPQSDKRLTIYDKSVESKGRINSIRLELRLRDGAAESAWQCLYGQGFQPRGVAAIVLGAVRFLNRANGDKNLCRLPLLKWWQQFVEYIEVAPFKIVQPKVVRHVEKTVDWLCRQVSSSLAVLSRVVGDKLISRLLRIGESRYKRVNWYRSLEKSFRYNLSDLISAFERHMAAVPSLSGDGSRWDWDYGWIPGEREEKGDGAGMPLVSDSPAARETVQGVIPGLDMPLPGLPKQGAVPPWVWEMQ